MGADAHVVVHGDPALVDLAQAEVERLEARWSRFLPTSEVSRLNAGAGDWVAVSPETVELVARSLEAVPASGGRFDPTVLGDVVRAGYDRPFAELPTDRPSSPTSPLGRGVDDVRVDRAAGAVRLPAGVGLDPGGIGKGLAADLVARAIDAQGAAGVLVNLGGDLRAMGCGPDGEDWTVDIDPLDQGAPVACLALDQGAIATSTTLRRRWAVDGARRHHLIDPATGQPAATDVVAATVAAAFGWQAEVLAKAALIAGLEAGAPLITTRGAVGLLVDRHGGLHPTPGFDRFTVAVPSATAEPLEVPS